MERPIARSLARELKPKEFDEVAGGHGDNNIIRGPTGQATTICDNAWGCYLDDFRGES